MAILTLAIGIILIAFSMISMSGSFSKNEWRAPLLELSFELNYERDKKLTYKELQLKGYGALHLHPNCLRQLLLSAER